MVSAVAAPTLPSAEQNSLGRVCTKTWDLVSLKRWLALRQSMAARLGTRQQNVGTATELGIAPQFSTLPCQSNAYVRANPGPGRRPEKPMNLREIPFTPFLYGEGTYELVSFSLAMANSCG